jgi:hypothetical protein
MNAAELLAVLIRYAETRYLCAQDERNKAMLRVANGPAIDLIANQMAVELYQGLMMEADAAAQFLKANTDVS